MGLTLDQFLGHTSSGKGGGAKYLSKWKKNNPPVVDTWLHTKCLIEPAWRHGLQRLHEKEDKESGDKTIEVWSDQWPCWEEEEILQNQNYRDKETGERQFPPCLCPVCKMVEFVRGMVEAGELKWTTSLFRFEGSDPDKRVTLHAAGLYNGFGRDDLTAEEKAEIKKAGIYRKNAWQEVMTAKLNYVFAVVDNAHPETGVQIATESSLLGDKVKEVINKAMQDAEDEGNPMENPYCIRWIHRPNENEIQKKYDAVRLSRVPLTDPIAKLIRETAPPDLTKVTRRRDPKLLLAALQGACLKPDLFDWDDLFSDAIAEWEKMAADRGSFDPEELEKETATPTPKPQNRPTVRGNRGQAPASTAQAPKKVQTVICPTCGEPVKSGPVCSLCGEPLPGTQGDAAVGRRVKPVAVAKTDPEDTIPY